MKTVKLSLVLCFVFSFFVVNPVSGAMMHSWDLNEQYIAHANPSTGGLFTQDGDFWYLSSVVNIGGGWGLTAAHVVELGNPYGGYFGQDVYSPDAYSLITDYYTHPSYTGNTARGYDLALVRFENELTSIPIASIGTQTPNIGDSISMTGYGQPGTAYNPSPQDGLSRGWDGVIFRFGHPRKADDNYLTAEWVNPFWSHSLPLGGLGANGDSGGGVYDEEGYLIAILAAVEASGNHYGIETFACLLDAHARSWISDTIDANSVPIPGAVYLLFSGLSILIGFRRYRG